MPSKDFQGTEQVIHQLTPIELRRGLILKGYVNVDFSGVLSPSLMP